MPSTWALMVAICCLGHWSLEQIVETYAISEAQCIAYLLKLDRLALIELRPLNRYRMRVSRAFRWLADGPVQQFFRSQVVDDYFAGRFDGLGETLLCVHGRLSEPSAQELVQKIQQLAAELGFEDDAYFSRFFKRHTGLSPRDFRAQALAQLASTAR